ncbi:hypothetical protein Rhopal_002110-T1 [Rhodotorula paludigena]|uniref:Integral membrane protein n=1 Tax=Rhodotorula paludigena TaxID=86838 RepID=A0AAV5G9Q0_9BASI|nr:hypothetical protein Rhopal_002110-T1 [Rhodotorula paludigena]
MADATPRVLAEEAVLDDSIAFGRSRLPLVRVLLCAVPWSALLFGMSLRLCVTYARKYRRDRWPSRLLVPLLAVLATGSVATQVAALFQVLTAAVKGGGYAAVGRPGIDATGQACATINLIVAQLFFITRLWPFAKSWLIRVPVLLLWVASSVLSLVWDIRVTSITLGNPLIDGSDRAWGLSSSWIVVASSGLVTSLLWHHLRQMRHAQIASRHGLKRVGMYICLYIEASGLVDIVFLAVGIAQALRNVSEAARLVGFFAFLSSPLVSTYSVMFALTQRPPSPVTPRPDKSSSSGEKHFGGSDLHSLQRFRSTLGCTSRSNADAAGVEPTPPEFTRSPHESVVPESTPYITLDPDDPQTWRGDAVRLFPSLRFDPAHSLSSAISRPEAAHSLREPARGTRSYNEAVIDRDETVAALNLDAFNVLR